MRPLMPHRIHPPFQELDPQSAWSQRPSDGPAPDTLRRFAPRALAERADRGEAVEAGEQEVSVLFADLRGYSTYAEGRPAREVFRVVSGYAQLAAGAIGDYGGLVVDFCGDGVMAVFGALEPVPGKERAALACAREISALVAQPPAGPSSAPVLSVGVGVATGDAYVGEIRAGEQSFWCAVGSTTNLAARLQQLTRELGCAIAADVRTCRAAGEVAAGLERRSGVPVRGYRAPQDVYVLPLDRT